MYQFLSIFVHIPCTYGGSTCYMGFYLVKLVDCDLYFLRNLLQAAPYFKKTSYFVTFLCYSDVGSHNLPVYNIVCHHLFLHIGSF